MTAVFQSEMTSEAAGVAIAASSSAPAAEVTEKNFICVFPKEMP
jgi:hypothetical protein